MSEQITLFLFFAATIASVFFVCICSLRQYCNSFCCHKLFHRGRRGSPESRNSEQYNVDRVLAESLQRRLNEEERERERAAKRKERRMWYEYYMKPYTMVIEKSNLFYAQGEKSPNEGQQMTQEEEDGNIAVQTETQRTSKDDDEFLDSDIEEIGENAKKQRTSQFIICDKDDEHATLYLKLPAAGGDDKTPRCVDGSCALCIDEYETGDNVVWSDSQCSHAFHKECLMQWLIKGKKRCPLCRHWFVPGTKIDDQKVTHGEAWQRALTEMEQREKEENERQALCSQKEPENDIKQRIVETTDTLPPGQNTAPVVISESPHVRSGDAELGSAILSHDSHDSEHLGFNNSLDMSELGDIESQRTVSSVPNQTTEKCHAVLHHNFSDGGDCHQEKAQQGDSVKSEEY